MNHDVTSQNEATLWVDTLWAAPWILLAGCVPLTTTALCTSDLTTLGRSSFESLRGHDKDRWMCLAITFLLAGYLLDLHLWKAPFNVFANMYAVVAGFCFVLGLLFHAHVAPTIPVLVGLVATIASVVFLRETVLRRLSVDRFMLLTGITFIFCAALLTGVWLLWALSPAFDGYHYWSVHRHKHVDFDSLSRFILWCSPLLLAFSSLLIGLLALLRGKIHASGTAEAESFIAQELRLLLCCLGFIAMAAWVAASLAAGDIGLSMTVLRLSSAMGMCIIAYMVCVLGYSRIIAAAESSNTVLLLVTFFESDWFKGIFLLFAWPLLPGYFFLEFVHQQVRGLTRSLHMKGATSSAAHEHLWITVEANERYEGLHSWNKSSVLVKSIWCGLAYFGLQVGVSRGLIVFLAWLSEFLAAWSLGGIMGLLFLVGLLMFLLPPVPGTPIYLISGIVLAQRCDQDHISFTHACIGSVAFATVLKFAAIYMQQRGIGEPFSNSIEVKKLVAINTPTMKAIKHILKQPGFSVGKVAVLIGGPDWPTSVLTGIYRLNPGEMLFGSIPVVLVIAPLSLAGAFIVKAAQDTEDAEEYQSLADVMIMASSMVLLSSMLIAGYYVEAVQEQFKDEIERGVWENDPQEKEVALATKWDKEDNDILEELGRWQRIPGWLKLLLYLGAILMCTMMYIILLQVGQPFVRFSLSSHISDLPGKRILGLVRPTGWLCLAFCGTSVAILASFYAWRWTRAPDAKSGELRQLCRAAG